MKIRRSSDYSFTLSFNNVDIDICYPLIRLDLTGIAVKLDTEISYYKLSNKKLIENNLAFLLLGFGIIVTVTKDIQH